MTTRAGRGARIVPAQEVASHFTRMAYVRDRVARQLAFGPARVATRERKNAEPDAEDEPSESRAWVSAPAHSVIACEQLLAKKSRNKLTLVGTCRADG